jgi:hypothetical protein
MKSIQLFLFAMLCLTLASCGEQWGGGLFIVPLLTTIGALIFGYKAFISSKSGSTQQTPYGAKEGGNVINKGYAIFFVICVVATIIIVAMINSDK